MATINTVKLSVDQSPEGQVSAVVTYNLTFSDAEIMDSAVFLERVTLKLVYSDGFENSFTLFKSFVKAQDCRVLRIVRPGNSAEMIYEELELLLTGLNGLDLPEIAYAQVDLTPYKAAMVSEQSAPITSGSRVGALALLN